MSKLDAIARMGRAPVLKNTKGNRFVEPQQFLGITSGEKISTYSPLRLSNPAYTKLQKQIKNGEVSPYVTKSVKYVDVSDRSVKKIHHALDTAVRKIENNSLIKKFTEAMLRLKADVESSQLLEFKPNKNGKGFTASLVQDFGSKEIYTAPKSTPKEMKKAISAVTEKINNSYLGEYGVNLKFDDLFTKKTSGHIDPNSINKIKINPNSEIYSQGKIIRKEDYPNNPFNRPLTLDKFFNKMASDFIKTLR